MSPALESLIAHFRDPAFIAEMAESNANEAALVDLMEQIRDTPDEDRHEALVWWARSGCWHAALMLCTGWQGTLASQAWRALKLDLGAESPGRKWDAADHAVGRASIARLLGLESHPQATFATAAFRTYVDDDARSWIAGAIGCPPYLDADALTRWRHLDISDVILWDPRRGEGRRAGEHPSTAHLILPYMQDERMTVFGDTGAFFRAWAGRRARRGELLQRHARGEWLHPCAEAPDSEMPGALVLGSVGKVQWRDVTAQTVIAGSGVTKDELRGAALRAAHLPKFTEGGDARG